jgi:hypothetical protein
MEKQGNMTSPKVYSSLTIELNEVKETLYNLKE